MKIEEKIAKLEADLESLKEELNQQNSKPKFKVGEVYTRKGHEGKYALTYRYDYSDTIGLMNLTHGKFWKTVLQEYTDMEDVKQTDKYITWSEMQFLTGNKADEFTVIRSEPKYFLGEEDEYFLRYNSKDLWHLVDEDNIKHPDLEGFGQTTDLFWEAVGQYELEITYE